MLMIDPSPIRISRRTSWRALISFLISAIDSASRLRASASLSGPPGGSFSMLWRQKNDFGPAGGIVKGTFARTKKKAKKTKATAQKLEVHKGKVHGLKKNRHARAVRLERGRTLMATKSPFPRSWERYT